MIRRISVRAIVVYEGKLLCVRLKPYEGSLSVSRDEWWCLPGGGLDESEGLIAGTIREMIEETGIEPKIGNLLYIQQFATPKTDAEHLEFFFYVTNAEDYLHVDLSKTSHGLQEIAEIKYVDPRATNILPGFLTTEDIQSKIDSNGSPTILSFLQSDKKSYTR